MNQQYNIAHTHVSGNEGNCLIQTKKSTQRVTMAIAVLLSLFRN